MEIWRWKFLSIFKGLLVSKNYRRLESAPLKSYTQNVVGRFGPDPFIKYQVWAYIGIISLKCYAVGFLLCVQVEVY